jgi:hypothetical protein
LTRSASRDNISFLSSMAVEDVAALNATKGRNLGLPGKLIAHREDDAGEGAD